MTAMNGIARADGAHLLTDSALLDSNHALIAIATKVLEYDAARLAISWDGRLDLNDVSDALATIDNEDQDAIMRALPGILRDMHEKNRRLVPGVPTTENISVNLLIAMWEKRSDTAQLWAISSDQLRTGPRYQPFTPVRLLQAMQIDPQAVLGRRIDLNEPADFDLRTDGLAVLEALRRQPWQDEDGPHYAVGGAAELTSVTAAGIERRVLKSCAEPIGERIDPFRSTERPKRRLGIFSRFQRRAAAANLGARHG